MNLCDTKPGLPWPDSTHLPGTSRHSIWIYSGIGGSIFAILLVLVIWFAWRVKRKRLGASRVRDQSTCQADPRTSHVNCADPRGSARSSHVNCAMTETSAQRTAARGSWFREEEIWAGIAWFPVNWKLNMFCWWNTTLKIKSPPLPHTLTLPSCVTLNTLALCSDCNNSESSTRSWPSPCWS